MHSSNSTSTSSIIVSNFKSGDTICYSLALIRGYITNQICGTYASQVCKVKHFSKACDSIKISEWPVRNSHFKCLIELKREENKIIIECCETDTELVLNYRPRKTSLSVVPVYIICSGHDGRFQAPAKTENTVRSACERIAVGAKLIQCLTAEKLNELNLGRKTFQLESDIDITAPNCATFHSQLSLERARKMNPHELWEHFGRELMMSSLGSERCKYLAFLSCTRYNPTKSGKFPKTYDDMLSMTEAHVALGGGGLAIFGSACLYTWARTVDEVQASFLNETKVDNRYFMDDSCYRGTYGSCFSTTLGSACHELGHTFDLGHSREGIMGRGFDNFGLVFTVGTSINNNSNVINKRESPVCRELPQNSVVYFSKLLNVSYTVSTIVNQVKSESENESNRNIIDFTAENNNTSGTSKTEECVQSHITKNIGNGNLLNGNTTSIPENLKINADFTFWSESCATILSYHRWFNDESPKLIGTLELDTFRKAVLSPAGIRVVEVRDGSGQNLKAWVFLERNGREVFPLPPEACSKTARLLVVEDSVGNLLKQELPLPTAVA